MSCIYGSYKNLILSEIRNYFNKETDFAIV